MKCQWTGLGEIRVSMLVGKSQCVLQKAFFNHNVYMLPRSLQLFKLDRLFYERFPFVVTKNPHT